MDLKDTQLVSENQNWLEKNNPVVTLNSAKIKVQWQNLGWKKGEKMLANVSGAKTPILQYGVPRDMVDKQVIKMLVY